jgi:hypothetical protein
MQLELLLTQQLLAQAFVMYAIQLLLKQKKNAFAIVQHAHLVRHAQHAQLVLVIAQAAQVVQLVQPVQAAQLDLLLKVELNKKNKASIFLP